MIDIIAGARPNFMKIAPILKAFDRRRSPENGRLYRLVHTGQHYDPRMSADFFEQLQIPSPDVNLQVGSGTPGQQAAAIMSRYEAVLAERRPSLCMVVGDVTSTMACAITAQKQHVPVAHVEGGIRSGDWTMPEEINRLVTDAITNYFFTTSSHANANLRATGVTDDRIFFVGNTMIDTLLANMDRLRPPSFWDDWALRSGTYLVLTLHRPSNVDDPGKLAAILELLGTAARGVPVVFPVHPRTARVMEGLGPLPQTIRTCEAQPYLEFNHLVRHALGVVTDSGGITEETTVMGIPCMTLRDSTERPETVELGTNELLGSDPAALGPALEKLLAGRWKQGTIPPLWDGRAGERIVEHLDRLGFLN
jgi:UDP-N-acetylglucosamine 2-epimerase (non-hydrolysing)